MSAALLIISLSINAQLTEKGSYFIAAICTDGIVIGADSRSAILSGITETPIVSYDTVQKVYVLDGFACAVAGIMKFSNKPLYYYLNQFSKNYKISGPIKYHMRQFLWFLRDSFPSLVDQFKNVNMIFAGYFKDTPSISYIKNNLIYSISKGAICSDSLSDFNDQFKPTMTCSEAAPLIENSIQNYTIKYKKEHTIGGPIMILKISKNNDTLWMKNAPSSAPRLSNKGLYNDFLTNKIKILNILNLSDSTLRVIFKKVEFNSQ